MVNEDENAPAEPNVFDLFGEPPATDPDQHRVVPVVDPDAGGDLPHWTDPPTGQIPILPGDADPDPWSELTGPQWHGEDSASSVGDDIREVFGDVGVGSENRPPRRPPVEEPPVEEAAPAAATGGTLGYRQARPRPRPQRPMADPSARNVPVAIGVGVAMVVAAGLAFRFGELTTALLVMFIAGLATAELGEAIRHRGLRPAGLLTVVAAGALPLGAHFEGVAAIPLVLVLLFVASAVWYLVGADQASHPALDLGTTLLGPLWVGVPAALAVLIAHFDDGISLLVVTIAIVVAYDTAAYAFGSWIGRTPFHSASGAKTWEGTIAGVVAAVVTALILGLLEISAYSDSLADMALLGLVASVLAMVGDLTESLVKRDLEVKDMSGLLPGHGGMFDRVDGLLFALCGTYYLTVFLGLT